MFMISSIISYFFSIKVDNQGGSSAPNCKTE